MKKTIWFILFLSHLTKAQDYELSNVPKAGSTKTGIEVFMLHYSALFEDLMQRHIEFHWLYERNATAENLTNAKKSTQELAIFKSESQLVAKNNSATYKTILNEQQQKMFEKILHIGPDALISGKLKTGKDEFKILNELSGDLLKTLHTATYKNHTAKAVDQILKLTYSDIHLSKFSDSPEKYYFDLLDTWHGTTSTVGRELKDDFTKYVELLNKSAKKNGFKTAREEQLFPYGDSIIKSVERTWQEIKPLYQKLHAVARFEIQNIFGEELVKSDGAIPAHLLGGLPSESWLPLFSLLKPEQSSPLPQNISLTPLQMAQYAEQYFINMGFAGLGEDFFNQSVFKLQSENKDECEKAAWDFKNKTVRISFCGESTRNDMQQMIDLFARVYYMQAFKEQNILLRSPPIPSFDHALAETFRLSATLFDQIAQVEPSTSKLNPLMYQALDKIIYMAFAYTLEKWRWDIYDEKTMPYEYQEAWDKLRFEEMGIIQPTKRDISDFDAGLKYHVSTGRDVVRYYVSTVLQFQFFESLCGGKPEGCDIQQNENGYKLLYPFMNKGASMDWRSILYDLTGDKDLNTKPLLSFFEPLEAHLDDVINKNNLYVGWQKWNPRDKLFVQKPNDPRYETEKSSSDSLNLTINFGFIMLVASRLISIII